VVERFRTGGLLREEIARITEAAEHQTMLATEPKRARGSTKEIGGAAPAYDTIVVARILKARTSRIATSQNMAL
jgi:hypothetical protein